MFSKPKLNPKPAPRGQSAKSKEIGSNPLRILEIKKTLNNKKNSIYEHKPEELRKWLDPIKDTDVAIIPIVGPSRMGKSFMLNFMSRFLSDPKNNDWMGRRNVPLTGFHWKAETEPQTDGIWISKPFIIERSNGKHIAVILLDTQGVFDGGTNERDWSTIVGLSLLVSSCLIFNIFTNLQEDAFIFLHDFLKYGLAASKLHQNMEKLKPFQNMLFLIRDWAVAGKFKFGLSGGNDYLNGKLVIKEEHSDKAQNARELLRDCFEEIECFLMPKIGEKLDEPGFNGSLGHLGEDFKRKLKDLILHLLNPDEIQAKRIGGKNLTGAEFCTLFENYVNVFNSSEMERPSTNDLLEVTARIADNIHMRRVKALHLKELRTLIKSQSFVSKMVLMTEFNRVKEQYIVIFENEMTSNSQTLIEEMDKCFDENLDVVNKENELKRTEFMTKVIEDCKKQFTELTINEMETKKYLDLTLFNNLLKTNEEIVVKNFKFNYNGEEETLFLKENLCLIQYINNEKEKMRQRLSQQLTEMENSKSKYVGINLENYQEQMQSILDNNVYLTDEAFRDLEHQIRDKTNKTFEDNFEYSNANDRIYNLDLQTKLRTLKNEYKAKNKQKSKDIVSNTKEQLGKVINEYKKIMNQMIDLIDTNESLVNRHKYTKDSVLEQFINNCLYNQKDFMIEFLNDFEEKINKSFKIFQGSVDGKIALFKNAYVTALDYYEQKLKSLYASTTLPCQAEVDKLNKSWRQSAINMYEDQFKDDKPSENLYLRYLVELQNKMDRFYLAFTENSETMRMKLETLIKNLSDEMIDEFKTRLSKIIGLENNQKELNNKLIDTKEYISILFVDRLKNNQTMQIDQTIIDSSLYDFLQLMNKSFDEMSNIIYSRKSEIRDEIKNNMDKAFEEYKQKMVEFKEMDEFYNSEEFEEIHAILKEGLILEFQTHYESNLDITEFVSILSQSIDKEYNRIVQERNENSKKIEAIFEMQLNLHKSKLDMFKLVNDQDNLDEKHMEIKETVLASFMQQNENNPKTHVLKYFTAFEKQIDENYFKFKSKLLDKGLKDDKIVEDKLLEAVSQYTQEFKVHFKEGDHYSDDYLYDFEKNIRLLTVNNFTEFLKYQAIMKHSTDNYMQQLIQRIDLEYQKIKINNDSNSSNAELLREVSLAILTRYETQMSSKLESFNSYSDFIDSSKKIKASLMKILDEKKNKNYVLLNEYKENIEIEFNDSEKRFEEKLKSRIIEGFKLQFNNLKTVYKKDMNKLFEEEFLITHQLLNENHEALLIELCQQFSNSFDKDFNLDVQPFLKQLSEILSEEYKLMETKFNSIQEKKFDKMIKEFIEKYEEAIEYFIKCSDTKEELLAKHKEIKKDIMEVFTALELEKHSEQTKNATLKRLSDEIEVYFNNFIIKLFEIELNQRKPIIENLKFKASQYYQEEMKKGLDHKPYVSDEELKRLHRNAMDNTKIKFRNEFGSLNDKIYNQTLIEIIEVIYRRLYDNNHLIRPKKSHAIGIDLGTTNTCVSYFKPTETNKFNVVIIPNEFGRSTTSSVVSIRDKEELVGDLAKEEIYAFNKQTLSSVKRLIGRKFNDKCVKDFIKIWNYRVVDDGENNPQICVRVKGNDQLYYPQQISAKVLRKMKELATTHLGYNVTKAVITVPAYFNDAQKEATRDAGKLAGLDVMRIINEPTAAAIAYRLNWAIDGNKRNVLIYDFGGGTFDVAVLAISKGMIDVKAVDGDNQLGGDDFDTNIISYCLEEFSIKHNVVIEGQNLESAISRLRPISEKCKIRLTGAERASIKSMSFYENIDLNIELTRKKFEEINNHLIERSMSLVEKTLKESKIKISEIDDIVLVGGTTRITKIQKRLSEIFNGKPLNHSVNPDEAVAIGAAIQAALLNENHSVKLDGELILSDVAPHSLGIQLKGGEFSSVIPKNEKVPTIVTKNYFTSVDNQVAVEFKIYEGENIVAKDNNLLGVFTLTEVPPDSKGKQRLPVTFEMNSEGILKVTAKIASTGKEANIIISERIGRLSDDKIKKLIKMGAFSYTAGFKKQ